ncbi:unnamed protein product [Caenorhabditis bovis]|uniref:Chloride channel CLIC-like protein 1 n=1 Tax=Caenorhabditis bovis TaxID=2654633 RepID=A0A8S1EW30_9PELO|nr:unnamed protein product [Caenorhabditis bovis]
MHLIHTLIIFLPFITANWIDPNDPTSSYKPQISNKVQKLDVIGDSSLRLILRQMLHELNVDLNGSSKIHKNVLVTIKQQSLSTISKFLNGEVEDTAETRENVRSALSGIFTVTDEIIDSWEYRWKSYQPLVFSLNTLLLPFCFVIVVRALVKPRNFWILIISSALLTSVYSKYNKKYQEAESRRFARFAQVQANGGHACEPEGIISRFFEIVASPFQYKQKSECLKYIESQTISIFHEISIIEVVSETISGGVFAFLSGIGTHLNKFFRDLYEGAPLLAQIVMTVFLLLMVGRIRTPFFSYEPILLTFGRKTIGKMVAWLEGGDEELRENPRILESRREHKQLTQEKLPIQFKNHSDNEKRKNKSRKSEPNVKNRSAKIEAPESNNESQTEESDWNDSENLSSFSE